MCPRAVSVVAATVLMSSGWVLAAPPAATYVPLTAEQIDRLTAPVALLPDPLLAQVLPASVYPLEVVTASQWARGHARPTDAEIVAQGWEPSVQALVRYPTLLARMAEDIASTQRLGLAYVHQPADVMASVQRMRRMAMDAGNLLSNQQQIVVVGPEYIEILPAAPDVIYVPIYDPAVCYWRHVGIRYDRPCRAGAWLDNDTDWNNGCVTTGHRWDRDEWEGHRHPGGDAPAGGGGGPTTPQQQSQPTAISRSRTEVPDAMVKVAKGSEVAPGRQWTPNEGKVRQPGVWPPVQPRDGGVGLRPTPLNPGRAGVGERVDDTSRGAARPLTSGRSEWPAAQSTQAAPSEPIAAPAPVPQAAPAPAPVQAREPVAAPPAAQSSRSSDSSGQSSSSSSSSSEPDRTGRSEERRSSSR